jgi:N6-adenosine-specific RNA methylase IME4
MKYHKFANIFPITTEMHSTMAADIRQNGLNNPIILFQGQILDGRNRFEACKLAGVEPIFKQFDGNEDQALDYVWSENFHRRHLSSSQRAAVAVEMDDMITMLREDAKKRQVAAGGDRKSEDYQEKSVSQKIDSPISDKNTRKTDAKLAAMSNSNRQYISDARKIKNTTPELHEKVKAGEIKVGDAKSLLKVEPEKAKQILDRVKAGEAKNVAEAKREVKKQEYQERVEQKEQERKAAPENIKTELPNLILADPPWKYRHCKTDNRKIENHYDTECVLDMKDHIPAHSDNCLLLLWVTAPKVKEAIELMDIWGFDYRTCAVWDKKKIGMGYWFRGQHELLFVGVKGDISPPLSDFRVSSIFEEPRSVHSKKPDCVYEWIEQAFGDKVKLEMYCRQPRDGWQVWGNEI